MGSKTHAPRYRPRVLWIGESPRLHTGFGRTTDEIIRHLAAGEAYELALLGWAWRGRGEAVDDSLPGIRVYTPVRRPWDPGCMQEVVDDFGPDVVITSGPLSALRSFAPLRVRPFVRWVGYAVFEGSPLSTRDVETALQMEAVAVPTRWGQEVLAGVGCESHVVPLGVDVTVFRPLPEREDLRAGSGLSGKFVIGCVGRNSFRKQIPILIRAFACFSEECAEAFLCLHTDPDDAGWRLAELAERHKVAERTAFTRGVTRVLGVSPEELNEVYNLFDVMVLPTMGEAFGLPILEAMAAGVPVVATDCSAVRELVASRGELVRPRALMTMPWDNAEYALVDEDEIVAKLRLLHADQALRRRHVENGRRFAESMTWHHSADAWRLLLDGVLRGRSSETQEDSRVRIRTARI